MKRGIEVWSEYDRTGRWCLRAKKARGRFTLDEVREAAENTSGTIICSSSMHITTMRMQEIAELMSEDDVKTLKMMLDDPEYIASHFNIFFTQDGEGYVRSGGTEAVEDDIGRRWD